MPDMKVERSNCTTIIIQNKLYVFHGDDNGTIESLDVGSNFPAWNICKV